MLIVNADDFGASRRVTDEILRVYDAGLVSSTTAMVWMADSERAAGLARERGMPVGLHLNLTLPYSADDVPAEALELQEELTGWFDAESWNQTEQRSRRGDQRIRDAVSQQLEVFRATFGEPTHLDGHHHIHVHPQVLACLPRELPIRPVLRTPGELHARRDRRERMLHKRFRAADACLSFPQLHPGTGGVGLDVLEYANGHVLEVMVHAQLEQEQLALRTPEWARALAAVRLGSYRELRDRGR